MTTESADAAVSNPPSSSRLEDDSALEARFADLCKELAVREDVAAEAVSLLKESKSILLSLQFAGRLHEEIEKYCFAFVLYCAWKLSKGQAVDEKRGGRFILNQILKLSELKLHDFIKEAHQFSLKIQTILCSQYGSDWEEMIKLNELEKNARLLTDASKFYNKAYSDMFTTATSGQHSGTSSCVRNISEFHHFGWLLFLVLRIHAPEFFKDLVSCIHGLVAILAILIIHVPTSFRSFSMQDSSHLVKRSEKGVDLLASLCHTYHTSEDCLKTMMGKAHDLVVDILNMIPSFASECKSDNLNQIDADGLTYFKELLDEKSLQSNLLVLERYYEESNGNQGDIDERMFVNDDKLLVTESPCGDSTSLCNGKCKFDSLASPTKTIESMLTLPFSPSSPVNCRPMSGSRVPQMTPVSSAMTTAKWLREVVSPLHQTPSSELLRFMSTCDRDVSKDVTCRANIILEAIFPSSSFGERSISGGFHCANVFDRAWAIERKMEALKLYYRVLEAICRAESRLPSGNNLTSLLSNERFHRCMLACSAEIVLAAHRTVIMMFPAVLENAGLTAFDLSKVIESFIRHEETLPRELKRHLNSLEEQVLESLAWQKGSSLYNSLIVARSDLATEINRLVLLAEPMPSLDEIVIHHNTIVGAPHLPSRKRDASPEQNGNARSPKRTCKEISSVLVGCNSFTPPAKERLLMFNSLKSKLQPLQSTFVSPTQPNPVGGSETCVDIGIKIFLTKVLKLAAIRIRSFCERLRQSQQFLERVYGIFQDILNKRTELFFNRHVDQIILCCFYAIAKVSKLHLTFKEIINDYRKEPQCKPEVFRSVFVGCSLANGNGGLGLLVDIITFYNEIFVPAVKLLLLGPVSSGIHEEDRNNAEGQNHQIPGSPKLSPFSNLPDISPKKVSSGHNVYVSPLRQSKMDALLSPSSRSYYACIGESTRAFRSPSNDLAVINNHLNSTGRRINGQINFDVVSDSVVAGSLGHQNGSSASSDAAATLGLMLKHQQPDH